MDHASSSGFDIQNLATSGANDFVGNTCISARNAPCPSVGPSLIANPNPIPVTRSAIGQTTISWNAPDAQVIEIHIGAPDGKLFTINGNRGSMQTEVWVTDGMTFYLQDVTGGKPLTSVYTLATLVVHLQTTVTNQGMPLIGRWSSGLSIGAAALFVSMSLFLISLLPRGRAGFAGAALALVILLFLPVIRAQPQPSPAKETNTLDRMLASKKSQQELARYVFDNYGCTGCHTLGAAGKLGFTSRGKEAGQQFEGCIRMLTDMNTIAGVPGNLRSAPQREKAARFEDFGCTVCHKAAEGKMALTEVGLKLMNAHVGCVDVEKRMAKGSRTSH